MFTEIRRNKILEILEAEGSVSVNELTKRLEFSPATIRSDLNYLSDKNLLTRTHGGAIINKEKSTAIERIEEDFTSRKKENQPKKVDLAKKAFEYVQDNSSIFLDASSTTYELASLINQSSLKLIIVTNGLNTANLLKTNQNVTTILIGGIVRGTSNAIESTLGVSMLDEINIDSAFFSAHAFNLTDGLTDFNLYEVELKKEVVKKSKEVFALIDSSKLEKSSLASFSAMDNIDYFITNISEVDETIKNLYLENNLNFV